VKDREARIGDEYDGFRSSDIFLRIRVPDTFGRLNPELGFGQLGKQADVGEITLTRVQEWKL
jgi:hypothetical protein